ncbi:MAG TPA: hypothetical protein VKF36_10970 [Syntrophorhabdales bacterium]|nr:hypothetical protein [Syntrophorhabdales bacterium]
MYKRDTEDSMSSHGTRLKGGIMTTTNMEWVEENGTAARGKREYLSFLGGQHLTMKERILANCYECTGMYTDGREDCEMETCAFHVYMPYRKNGVVKVRTLSGETKAKLREARLQRGENLKSVVVA